jgi:CRISPR-associated protein Cmr4
MKAKTYWIHALTPLHVGAGRGVGFIDLPIAREKLTQWPMVPGSGVKGVFRDYFSTQTAPSALFTRAFGEAEQGTDEGQAGSLVFTDARIVLLPVRSIYGTFAYVTSPLALQRLQRDLREVHHTGVPADLPQPGQQILIPGKSEVAKDNKVYLEDLDFTAKSDDIVKKWADFMAPLVFDADWHKLFQERFVVVSDQHFDFLCETATEVNARIRIEDDTKIVAKGALWYEESLPAETVLSGTVWCDRVYGSKDVSTEQLLQQFCTASVHCQMGGKATTGKGRVRCTFSN